uniref:Uncharacterized protein n=1 Tax=Rhizophora mucronata TaxID=61149 RepID=A0A2P2PUA8_RHIMU
MMTTFCYNAKRLAAPVSLKAEFPGVYSPLYFGVWILELHWEHVFFSFFDPGDL